MAACGANGAGSTSDGIVRQQVALVPATPRTDVDLLFVLDDSIGGVEMQGSLRKAFPAFLTALAGGGELPSLHIGVVSTDLGTLGAEDAAPGPGIGSGPGSCAGVGKDAALLNHGSLVTGTFISDVRNPDGTRTTNYSDSLATAFASIAALGGSGCGFEQPVEVTRRALDAHPANVGFVRADAPLAVIMLTDEDDCSLAHSSLLGTDPALGPLQSFRCTRFGVACSDGGVTTDDMYTIGIKHGCRWREDAPYLTARSRYTDFFDTLKPDPRDVLVAAIAGQPVDPIEVEARTPPGGGMAIPALAHGCTYNGVVGPSVADPAVRITDLVHAMPRGRVEPICNEDQTDAVLGIAREIRGMLGDSCLTRDIALPADCHVVDQTLAGETPISRCSAERTTDCYSLVDDPACVTPQHLRVEVARSAAPAADTMVAVRCRI